jgi:hypothetical protein
VCSVAEAQHLQEIDYQLALFLLHLCPYGCTGVEVLESKAVLVDLRPQEAKEGLGWNSVVIVAVRRLFPLRLLY